MKATVYLLGCLSLISLLLAGCWDKNELTDWGFVQAVAIDRSESGRIKVMAQIYRPGSSESRSGMATKGGSYLSLTEEAATMSEASLKLAAELGRRLQWSHMRALLVGEQVIRTRNIGELLDFFSRSQGPRGSVNVMTTQGEASRYLLIKPLIENTIGQQLRTAESIASTQAGISTTITLLDLNILSQTPGSIALLPHIRLSKDEHEVVTIDSLAILRFPEGTIDASLVPMQFAPYLLMIRGEYRRGQLSIPCEKEEGKGSSGVTKEDSYWVYASKSRLKVTQRGGRPLIRIHLDLDGKMGEMTCSDIQTVDGNAHFLKRVAEEIERGAKDAVDFVQEKKADVLLAGQYLERRNPRLWRSWSGDWAEQFSYAKVIVTVSARITDTGMNAGNPFTAVSGSP
ncbi:Ger(x)C family spore germination protein [Cohnella faecalis]|uniref:Ger(X)C family spore germination protein n=1 Tax=Cohnella faecalis TaxID=2315694 RepID=A0A398CEJ7_9BACL|nr:Ger(x)C family spore germination protein [Cohnella faecalis]RIE01133.1 Ger(x)C family spore germination protein [Cohnella faecalis]